MKAISDNHKALLAVLFATFATGFVPVFVKIGVKEIPPFSYSAIRFIIAALVIFILMKNQIKFKIRQQYDIIFVSLLSSINIILFAFAIQLTTATIAQTLYVTVPIITTVFSLLIIKEKLNLRKVGGITIGFIGAVAVIFLPVLGKYSLYKGNFVGNFLVFVGAVLYSLYIVFSKKLQKKYSARYITAMFIMTTAITSVFLSLTDFYTHPFWWNNISVSVIYSIIMVSVVGTVGYYFLYQYAIKKGSPVVASMIQYLTPSMTFIFAFFMLHERLTSGFIFGAMLTILGAWMVTSKKE